jgi:putative ABC transport system substrate-binding protein
VTSAIAASPPVRAQQPRIPSIGIPSTGVNPRSAPFYLAFEQRLRELGWIDGQSVRLLFSPTQDEPSGLVAEMVQQRVDVILVTGAESLLKAASKATRTIPIVMLALNFDPVEKGYVASLAHPGANITGISARNLEIGAKQLELLKEALPRVVRIGVLWDAVAADQVPAIENAATQLQVELERAEVRPPYGFERAFEMLRERRAEAVLVVGSPISYRERTRIAQLALRHNMPSIDGKAGGIAGDLIGFGFDLDELYRQTAEYVDKVLRGGKPADLPVAQPTKFELVINLKTAKALGLTIPQSLLVRADEVIQ